MSKPKVRCGVCGSGYTVYTKRKGWHCTMCTAHYPVVYIVLKIVHNRGILFKSKHVCLFNNYTLPVLIPRYKYHLKGEDLYTLGWF